MDVSVNGTIQRGLREYPQQMILTAESFDDERILESLLALVTQKGKATITIPGRENQLTISFKRTRKL